MDENIEGELELAVIEAITDIRPALSLLESMVKAQGSRYYLKAMLDTMPFPGWVKDEAGGLLWINKAYEQHFGTCCQECLGNPASPRHSSVFASVGESDRRALETKQLIVIDDLTLGDHRKVLKLAVDYRGETLIFGVSLPHDTLTNTQNHIALNG